MNTPLPPALHAESIRFGGIHCYVAGDGPPLLLVHSVNAAASAADVRPLFERYRNSRRVFALDLPGFGLSDRHAPTSTADYTPRQMTDALHATLAQIEQQCGDVPVDALAASLGCEFLARAAAEAPARFNRLAFVSPTGLQGNTDLRQADGSTREVGWLYGLLRQPLWAEWLFRQLTRPGVVPTFCNAPGAANTSTKRCGRIACSRLASPALTMRRCAFWRAGFSVPTSTAFMKA